MDLLIIQLLGGREFAVWMMRLKLRPSRIYPKSYNDSAIPACYLTNSFRERMLCQICFVDCLSAEDGQTIDKTYLTNY
jgi:hypothetical protein